MPDLWHRLLKWVDHNRHSFAALALSAVVIGSATSCQPRVASPFTGAPATQVQIAQQAEQFKADLAAQASDAQTALEVTRAEVEAQVHALALDHQARTAALESKLRIAGLEHQAQLATLQTQARAAEARLDHALREIAQRKRAAQQVLELVAGVAVQALGADYAGLIGSAVGIAGVLLGGGAYLDNRRKDALLRERDDAALA